MPQLTLSLDPNPMPTIEFAQRTAWSRVPRTMSQLREACIRLDAELARSQVSSPIRYLLHGRRRISVSVGPEDVGLRVDLHWALLLDTARSASMIGTAIDRGRYPRWTTSYLDELASSPQVSVGLPQPRTMRLEPIGQHVNLESVRDDCLVRLPELLRSTDHPPAIGWGRRARGTRQTRIRLGSARLEEQAIVIHPVLDSPDVPRWVTEFVVHHELCHFAAPPLTRDEARARREHRLHHHGFKALEARHPKAQEASEWSRVNLRQLLTKRARLPER